MSISFKVSVIVVEKYLKDAFRPSLGEEIFNEVIADFHIGNSGRLRDRLFLGVPETDLGFPDFGEEEATPEETMDWLRKIHREFSNSFSQNDESLYSLVAGFIDKVKVNQLSPVKYTICKISWG